MSFFVIILVLIFDLNTVDSNTDKVLIYDKNDLYNRELYNVYFKNLNTFDINNLNENYDLEILNYYIEDNIYYARNVDKLLELYTKDMNHDNKIKYEINGIKISGLGIFTTPKELMKIEKDYDVY